MPSRLIRVTAALAACSMLIAACGASTATHTTSKHAQKAAAPMKPVSGHATVKVKNFMYMPMKLTVTAGTKVTFHNYDQTAHTATAIDDGFSTGTIKPGKSATVTLKKPGTYKYHCLFHAFMVAKIVVVKAEGDAS